MCRFVVYAGPETAISSLVSEPKHSLIHQSYHAALRSEPLNGDGFGLGWYSEGRDEPAVFRSIQPAWNNENLRELARVTESSLIFAHVRAATGDMEVSQSNCHPFKSGKLLFMHNGAISNFASLRRSIQHGLSDASFARLRGTTDSEHLFARVQDLYEAYAELPDAERLLRSVRECVDFACSLGAEQVFLNLAVTDGTNVVATRFANTGEPHSLFYLRGSRFHYLDGICEMSGSEESSLLVASEPLGDGQPWVEVPSNHLLLWRAGGQFELESLEIPSTQTVTGSR